MAKLVLVLVLLYLSFWGTRVDVCVLWMYRISFFLESGWNRILLDIRWDIPPEPVPQPDSVMYNVFQYFQFFISRRYASMVYALVLCPFILLSHASIVSYDHANSAIW